MPGRYVLFIYIYFLEIKDIQKKKRGNLYEEGIPLLMNCSIYAFL